MLRPKCHSEIFSITDCIISFLKMGRWEKFCYNNLCVLCWITKATKYFLSPNQSQGSFKGRISSPSSDCSSFEFLTTAVFEVILAPLGLKIIHRISNQLCTFCIQSVITVEFISQEYYLSEISIDVRRSVILSAEFLVPISSHCLKFRFVINTDFAKFYTCT